MLRHFHSKKDRNSFTIPLQGPLRPPRPAQPFCGVLRGLRAPPRLVALRA